MATLQTVVTLMTLFPTLDILAKTLQRQLALFIAVCI